MGVLPAMLAASAMAVGSVLGTASARPAHVPQKRIPVVAQYTALTGWPHPWHRVEKIAAKRHLMQAAGLTEAKSSRCFGFRQAVGYGFTCNAVVGSGIVLQVRVPHVTQTGRFTFGIRQLGR
jgi:hypothetical protein